GGEKRGRLRRAIAEEPRRERKKDRDGPGAGQRRGALRRRPLEVIGAGAAELGGELGAAAAGELIGVQPAGQLRRGEAAPDLVGREGPFFDEGIDESRAGRL